MNQRVALSSQVCLYFEFELKQETVLEWTPKTHWLLFNDERELVMIVLMMAALKPDGTPWHPETVFWRLPKDLIFLILEFSMSFNQ